MQPHILSRFTAALPQLRAWIDRLLDVHAERARAVSALGCARLAASFPPELLDRAKVVTVDPVPFPPVDAFGLPEFAALQRMPLEGITFKDTFFVRRGRESESLYFHELVHVVQWSTLGEERFLLAYGFGLFTFGYRESPLERMAYELQKAFDTESLPPGFVQGIQRQSEAIWAQAEPIVREALAAANPG
jgi:hypothetical protein